MCQPHWFSVLKLFGFSACLGFGEFQTKSDCAWYISIYQFFPQTTMVIYKYFKSFKRKTLSCFGFGFIPYCISLGLDFSNFFLVFQFWTLNFFINASLWQSPLGIFGNFFLVLAQITLTFYSHCYYTIPCVLKKKKFFFENFQPSWIAIGL